MMSVDAIHCPLCDTAVQAVLFSKKEVRYYSCGECGLVFMDPAHLPSVEEERERYLQHNNDPEDDGYVTHLMDIGERVRGALTNGARGLDYGCGTAQVMAAELEKRGLTCSSYDPLFADDRFLLRKTYDFITCCEAIEHFHRPCVELIKLTNMLKEGGLLGLKTSLIEEVADYERWYYANDPSHVVFLRDRTVDWISRTFRLDVVEREDGRVVLRKLARPEPLQVVAGVIERNGLLLTARRDGAADSGKWEFPGGKIHDGESSGEALVREISEEMGLDVAAGALVASLKVPVGGRWIELIFSRGTAKGEPSKLEAHSDWKWVAPENLAEMRLMEGDRAFCDMYL